MCISECKKIILLVEDNQDDELLTVMALKAHKVANEIVVARDGEEAVQYLFAEGPYAGRNPAQTPQLILLDLNLPRISGLDVLKRIRSDERTKWTPVVILTTSNEEADLEGGYSLCVNSYIRKPVDFEKFSEAVKQLSTYWLVMNECPPKTGKP